MRKRSSYRPKGIRPDAVAYVLSSIKPLSQVDDALTTLKIKNHGAMAAVTQGYAGRDDMDVLIAATNIAEALALKGIGADYAEEIRAGQDALKSLCARGVKRGNRFIFKAEEMQALNLAMEVHDAQLEVATVKQLEQAVDFVRETIRLGKARKII